MTAYVGVDAGQSSVDIAIGDGAGRTVATARFEQPSFVGDGRDALARVEQFAALAREAYARLAPDPGQLHIGALVAGISGHNRDEEQSRSVGGVARVRFLHDATVAHAAAFGDGDGIVVIAGSGSVAFGRLGGRSARAGGWGQVFGDGGSAFWLGRRAVSLAMEAHDRKRLTPLTELVCGGLAAETLRDVQREYAAGRVSSQRVAALAVPLLAEAAAEPNGDAARLAADAIAALWQLTSLIAERLSAAGNLAVSPTGGLFASAWFAARFAAAAPARFIVTAAPCTSAEGALHLAFRDAGIRATAACG